MASRKDYERAARAIRVATSVTDGLRPALSDAGCDGSYINGRDDATRTIADAFADAFAADNPRFDRARFLAACGVQS